MEFCYDKIYNDTDTTNASTWWRELPKHKKIHMFVGIHKIKEVHFKLSTAHQIISLFPGSKIT